MIKMTGIEEYFKELEMDVRTVRDTGLLNNLEKLVDIFYLHYLRNNALNTHHEEVYAFGNGGSAANASHFAAHFSEDIFPPEKRKFTVVSLVDNMPRLTAKGNDLGYENIFSDYLKGRVLTGDIVVAFSGSGNSPNVVEAVRLAKAEGAYVIGFTGDYKGRNGGKLAEVADLPIVVPSMSMERIEDIHSSLYHAAKEELRRKINGE